MQYKAGIVILSSINWSTHNQLHHELTRYFIMQGHKVLFVENTGTRSISLYDYKRIIHRLKKYFKSSLGFVNKNKSLTIFSPLFFPFQFLKIFVKINSQIIYRSISKWIFENNSPVIVISFLPNPLSYEVSKKIKNNILVYYCADDMITNSNNSRVLNSFEQKLLKKSDLIFYTSKTLGNKFDKYKYKSFLVRNGVNFTKFNSVLNKELIKNDYSNFNKIIGYVGALRSIIDYELLFKISEKYKDYALLLIGPIYPQVLKNKYFQKIRNKKNVFFLGSLDHKDIPNLTSLFNVSLIPYIKNIITDSIYPVKLNEYLALGIPVIASNINEIQDISIENSNVINSYENHNQCINQINQSLKNDSIQLKDARIKYAKNNDWNKKFELVYEKINIFLDKKIDNLDFEKKILFNFRKRIKKTLIFTSVFLFAYLMIFNSPIFPLLSKNLIFQENLVTKDNLIAFVGSGELNYNNFSYRVRALEILKYYDHINTNNIIIISGRTKDIADVEIIKAYLISKGVKEYKIKIPERLPSSTYDGVLLAYDEIKNFKNQNFLVLTSPYHSKRLKKTWEKNFDEINVIFPIFSDNDDVNYFYKMPFDKIKVVIYEYLALIHNTMFNRI